MYKNLAIRYSTFLVRYSKNNDEVFLQRNGSPFRELEGAGSLFL